MEKLKHITYILVEVVTFDPLGNLQEMFSSQFPLATTKFNRDLERRTLLIE